jgi:NACalpha-BTF3-like transcription factor
MYLAVKNDADKKLKPTDRKGVSCKRHYKCLGPDNFVPPLLHLEIGMVNQVWEAFEEWVDAIVEVVPPFERDARTEVKNAKEKLELAIEEKKQVDATTNIEIRDKSGTLNVIKAQLRRKNLENGRKEELQVQLTLLNTFISELKDKVKCCKDNLKACQINFAESKKKLANCREERGKPEAGISADIELVLEKYNVSRAAYHGGDYNGVSCRRLVGNCEKIMEEIQIILETKKNETCDNTTINEKVKQIEHTLGLLDVAFYYLNIPHPTDDEKIKAKYAVEALSKQWRDIGLSVTLKAHVMEQHIVACNNNYGIGDKEESFIEQGHQIGIKENRRYQGMSNFQKKMEASLKARTIATHPLIIEQNQKVLQQTKRKRPDRVTNHNEGVEKIKSNNIQVKKEQKKVKRECYINTLMSKNEK